MKKLISLIIGGILLTPTLVFAADFTVTLTCPASVDSGEEFTCTVSTSDSTVTAFQATIDLTDAPNLQLNQTKEIESFIGRTGNIFLKSSEDGSGLQKIKLTSITDSSSRMANNVESVVTVGKSVSNPKDNPGTSIDAALVIILVVSVLGIGGYYVFNKNSRFISI